VVEAHGLQFVGGVVGVVPGVGAVTVLGAVAERVVGVALDQVAGGAVVDFGEAVEGVVEVLVLGGAAGDGLGVGGAVADGIVAVEVVGEVAGAAVVDPVGDPRQGVVGVPLVLGVDAVGEPFLGEPAVGDPAQAVGRVIGVVVVRLGNLVPGDLAQGVAGVVDDVRAGVAGVGRGGLGEQAAAVGVAADAVRARDLGALQVAVPDRAGVKEGGDR
jgi:hypothetical protein